jgi:hypothetical protein
MSFVWKHPKSGFWFARFTDASGKKRNKSTKVKAQAKNKAQAERIAAQFEEAFNKRRTAKQLLAAMAEGHLARP